jgi:hypothetical protein
MSKVFITDYISNPDIERRILGDYLTDKPSDSVEVLLVWHECINEAFCMQFPNLRGVVRYGVGYDNLYDFKLAQLLYSNKSVFQNL